MSDSRQPHRRRRAQAIVQDPAMQEPAAQIPAEEENIKRPDFRPQEIPKEMHRIVVTDGDEPDWMVSANRVSGAAERRGAPAGKGVQPEEKTEKSAAAKPVRTHAAAAEKPKASKPCIADQAFNFIIF